MKTFFYAIVFLIGSQFAIAQDNPSFTDQEIEVNKFINGTLLLPNGVAKPNLAIIIAGSGPTDRDGNQNFLKTNNLKKLAVGLTKQDIATFRYDKRIVKQIRKGNVDKNMMFDDFVTDAISVVEYFRNSDAYNRIYIIGHSQGSLVGLLAARDRADGFISLAGAGQSIDMVITEQVIKTAPMFKDDTIRIFDVLKEGKTTKDYPIALSSIFNLDVQPFIRNWMKYNPQTEIAKLEMPILIINGTKDLQVSEAEAKLLHEAAKSSTLKIIENMNHVLVTIEGDDLENSKSYNESGRKLAEGLLNELTQFIK
ncbi:alpha/beta hydrolase family protein [Aurantibacter aestuarii]|uniref:Alpha/beta hydrolase n=1 Tax=Aurantibacter aestuarii TaxID=1266046 RepID=A0A2T1N4T4_9FLAO|nr:alpha/beta hydrolase [Aurantibacter aestuarii]PSG86284.1 alpha/beta hydrolase [Aurantibacter aestuarii]